MDDYEKYLEDKLKFQEANEIYLTGFEEWLKNAGLTKQTINSHLSNVEYYINIYLCYDDIPEISAGCYFISGYLGYWYITKEIWASCAKIKSVAASIKKFYKYMLEMGLVVQDDYDSLLKTIKEEMSDWLESKEHYYRFGCFDESEFDALYDFETG